MTTVVLAPDSFKESMSALEACRAMERGILSAWPGTTCLTRPMADGGEGTVEAILTALGPRARHMQLVAHDALMRPRRASLAWIPDAATAVVEIAQGPGLEHIAPSERDIWGATSVGAGEMISAALDLGARRIIVGAGGSAVNDAGAGMLSALGVRFIDEGGAVVSAGPRGLLHVETVDVTGLDSRVAEVEVIVATDVSNPLLGPQGASAVFGPQKGASEEDVVLLDDVLARVADLAATACGLDRRDAPGAGAAGGIGWAAQQVLGASMRPGVEVVAELVDLSGALAGAALVFTGEGSVDVQTLSGKTPVGVIDMACTAGVPVIVVAGRVGTGAHRLIERGASAVIPMVRDAGADVLAGGPANLQFCTEQICRLIDLGQRLEEGSQSASASSSSMSGTGPVASPEA